ncbi:MAG: putative PEP-binding protein [Trichococcus flocculiformis]
MYRTEFLYMDSSDFPTEDEQFDAYKAVLEGMEGKPVVVRTMDIGGDKELPYLELPKEMNPFLGYRAIRISALAGTRDVPYTIACLACVLPFTVNCASCSR